MNFVPNPELVFEFVELDLSSFYEIEVIFNINQPSDVKYIVLDSSHTLIGFNYQPIKSGNFYHPQPGSDFIILGQIFDKDNNTLPLLATSHLLEAVVS